MVPSDLNITLGQGTAIKEVYNVKKQSLENNQEFIAQHAVAEKNKDQSKIKTFDDAVKVEIKKDKEKNDRRREKRKSDDSDEENEDALARPEGRRLDIKV